MLSRTPETGRRCGRWWLDRGKNGNSAPCQSWFGSRVRVNASYGTVEVSVSASSGTHVRVHLTHQHAGLQSLPNENDVPLLS